VRAEQEFLASVAQQGGRLASGARYVDSATPVAVICALGHTWRATPRNVQQGWGICDPCGKAAAKAKTGAARVEKAASSFLARVESQGGRLASGARYIDNNTPVDVVCANGHLCRPRPGSVQKGRGVCAKCNVTFDRVYLLTHERHQAVKVGIASGSSRVRSHVARGYRLEAQWLEVEHDEARRIERLVIASWRDHGDEPVEEAPKDGRSETASRGVLGVTLETMIVELGEPSEVR
jgi:hypothetical protein